MAKTDPDQGKGAVEQNAPGQHTNTSLEEQLGHRNQDVLNKTNDTDFPEAGQTPEHSGQPQGRNQLEQDTQMGCGNNPEGETQNQDPGERQKRNQGDKGDDPLAA